MNIGIVGLGYVGLTLAIAAADKGINVYGVEVDNHIKECLADNKAHFWEPGLNNMIRRNNGKTFHVVDKFSKDVKYDAFIITVGTPLRDGEKKPDFTYIQSALKGTIREIYDGTQAIILRSTVSVGTTRKVVIPLLAQMSGQKEEDVLAGMCPERTLEGNAINELTKLPQIVSGNNKKTLEIINRLFRKITPYVIEVGSLEEAELIKLYCNTYRDMTFAIGNAFCVAAQKFNVDGIDTIMHANEGYARSNIAYPGFVAGPCLEKDAYILIEDMPECDSKDFILAARKFNESLEDYVVQWVEDNIGIPSDGNEIVLALSGMAFKGKPETSDLRGSSSVYIAQKLKKKGYTLRLHDFVALPEEMEALNLGEYYGDVYDACDGASALLVLNNHAKYSSLMDSAVLHSESKGFKILDAWNVCTELHYCSEIDICTLGNMMINKGIDG